MSNPPPDNSVCSYRAGDAEPCLKDADWVIIWNGDESTATGCCAEHLEALVESSEEYTVYPSGEVSAKNEADFKEATKEWVSLSTLSHEERFTCPRRIELTHGFTTHDDDYWQHNPTEHFQRCSFCGSVRPEDAIGMLRTGWRMVSSDKDFMCILVPLGGDASYYVTKTYRVYKQHFGADQSLLRRFEQAGRESRR